jgi:hypothetical protein
VRKARRVRIMRKFAEGLPARVAARILSVVFLWSVGLTGMGPGSAEAQIVTRAATSAMVAVVPFENLSGYRPETFGEEAGDAVAVELRDRLGLDVVPKAEVSLMMRDLGLDLPLTDGELVRLATELELELVVTGQVRGARVLRGPEGPYGEVELAVRLFDRVARADLNGALVRVRGPAVAEGSQEVLLSKALEQAAFEAVQQMRTRPAITAMVLWARDSNVFLNVGTRGGVKAGTRLAAIRGGKRIGLVEVSDADAIGANARIVEGPPLRTGDYLRAIFELPAAKVSVAEQVKQKGPGVARMLAGAALLLGLGGIGHSARIITEADVAAPAFTASNLANGWELMYAGPLFEPCALVTWEPYRSTGERRILAYEIYTQNRGLIWIADPATQDLGRTNTFFDMWNMAYGYYDGYITFNTVTGEPIVSLVWELLDPDEDPPATGIFIETDDYGVTEIEYIWLTPDGPMPGEFAVYQVRPVILERVSIAPESYEWRITREVEWSSTQNTLTWVAPPWPAGATVAGMLGTFFFYHPWGADQAIIQIARDPYNTFPPEQTYSQTVSGVWTDPYELYNMESFQVDLTQVPGTGDIYWWRIGARNRSDRVAPRPWPPEKANDYGYVWSPVQRLVVFTPLSRVSVMHKQRESLVRSKVTRDRVPRRPQRDRVLRAE